MSARLFIGSAAAIAALGLSLSHAHAQTRNCPGAENQLVAVQPGQPAAFRLNVTNLGDSGVAVFQHPLGGELHAAGPTLLDYVFLPDASYAGHTTMRYRVEPPAACGLAPLLAEVTFAGSNSSATIDVQGQIGVGPAACGTGLTAAPIGLAVVGLTLLSGKRRISRVARSRGIRTLDD